jgi:hypothetical protein
MSRGPCTFKKQDLRRALEAAVAAGMTVERAWVEIDGTIVLGFATTSINELDSKHQHDTRSWDEVLDGNR